jgi:hypothetical protein
MHVTEESHCGIVPMNHSNKDGTSSAESEEGRLRIKESASQSNTCPTQSGEACVSQGLTGVRTSGSLGRYSSEIRTGCAKERPSGSVRGCALKAHGVQFPEMETAAKPSSQPRTKSCVVTGNGHCEA